MNEFLILSHTFCKLSSEFYWMTTWNSVQPELTEDLILKDTNDESLARTAKSIHEYFDVWAEAAKTNVFKMESVLIYLPDSKMGIGSINNFLSRVKEIGLKNFSDNSRRFLKVVIDYTTTYKNVIEGTTIDLEKYSNLLFVPTEKIIERLVQKITSQIKYVRSKIDTSEKSVDYNFEIFIGRDLLDFLFPLLQIDDNEFQMRDLIDEMKKEVQQNIISILRDSEDENDFWNESQSFLISIFQNIFEPVNNSDYYKRGIVVLQNIAQNKETISCLRNITRRLEAYFKDRNILNDLFNGAQRISHHKKLDLIVIESYEKSF